MGGVEVGEVGSVVAAGEEDALDDLVGQEAAQDLHPHRGRPLLLMSPNGGGEGGGGGGGGFDLDLADSFLSDVEVVRGRQAAEQTRGEMKRTARSAPHLDEGNDELLRQFLLSPTLRRTSTIRLVGKTCSEFRWSVRTWYSLKR